MKISVSLPEPLFKETQAVAKKLGVSRSRLVQMALQGFFEQRKPDEVTRRLNRSFAKHPPEDLDPFLQHLAFEGMKRAVWKY